MTTYLYHETISDSVSETNVASGLPEDESVLLLSVYIKPTVASALSAVSVTVNWNDDQPRSHTEICLLTSLSLFISEQFTAILAPASSVSIEATLTGLGECELYLIQLAP